MENQNREVLIQVWEEVKKIEKRYWKKYRKTETLLDLKVWRLLSDAEQVAFENYCKSFKTEVPTEVKEAE